VQLCGWLAATDQNNAHGKAYKCLVAAVKIIVDCSLQEITSRSCENRELEKHESVE